MPRKAVPAIDKFQSAFEHDTNGGCWLWTGAPAANGYGQLWDGPRQVKAHRFSYATFIGPIPDGLFVCHHCDVRLCVNPSHLFVGTRQDNIDDMVRKGRQRKGPAPWSRGERHHAARLVEADVLAIRASTENLRTVSARYGVSRSQISLIRLRRSWACVPEQSEGAA